MAPQTQKTLVISKFKGPWELRTDQPVHKAGKGQLLVKNEAVALNPVDWKIQKLGWFITEDSAYPAQVGTDIAGVVEEVGEGVTNFAKGDRVVFQGSWSATHGGYQQYTVTEAATTAKIPDGVSFDEAATIPVALAVTVVAFYQNKVGQWKGANLGEPFNNPNEKKYAGKTTVILGGSSSVGQFGIQLAKLSGFSNIITTSSLKHTDFLKSLGATHIIDRSTPAAKIVEEVKKIAGGTLPSFVYDSISSKDTQQLAHDLTAVGGTTVVVLPPELKAAEGKELYHALGIFPLSPENQALGNRLYASLTKLIADKHIVPNRPQVLPNGLAGVTAGLDLLEQDKVSGTKLVIHPQE